MTCERVSDSVRHRPQRGESPSPIGPHHDAVGAQTGSGHDSDTCTGKRRRWGAWCRSKLEHFNSIDVAPDDLVAGSHPTFSYRVGCPLVHLADRRPIPHRRPVEPVQAPAFSPYNIFTSSDNIAGLTNDAINPSPDGNRLGCSVERHTCVHRQTGLTTQLARRRAARGGAHVSNGTDLVEDCHDPELRHTLGHFMTTLGFVPNSLLTMQRVPAIAKAVVPSTSGLQSRRPRRSRTQATRRPHGELRRGCQYSKAHTTVSATRQASPTRRWRRSTSHQRARCSPTASGLRSTSLEAASLPNGVTDDSYKALARHWTDDEIVEILGVVCMFGVFNRWNDSMATPLEAEPIARAGALLGDADWNVGKHTPSP